MAAAVAELVSLPAIGPNILFPYGLAVGACVAIVNLNLISATIERAVESGRKSPVIIGFIVRVLLYGGALWLAATTSLFSGLGAAIGILIPHIVLYARHALIPALKRKLDKEPPSIYVVDTRSNMFVKEPWLVRDGKARDGKVRTYLTHRHYRKVKIGK